jgi:hypothetical protein
VTRYLFFGRLERLRARTGHTHKISPQLDFEPQIIQPEASRYTACVVPVTIIIPMRINEFLSKLHYLFFLIVCIGLFCYCQMLTYADCRQMKCLWTWNRECLGSVWSWWYWVLLRSAGTEGSSWYFASGWPVCRSTFQVAKLRYFVIRIFKITFITILLVFSAFMFLPPPLFFVCRIFYST